MQEGGASRGEASFNKCGPTMDLGRSEQDASCFLGKNKERVETLKEDSQRKHSGEHLTFHKSEIKT